MQQYLFKKLESIIFYLLIFSIPVQARLILHKWGGPLAPHLSPPGAGAGFNQWTSAYLYGTDILLAILFVLWATRLLCGGDKVSRISYLVSSIKNQILNTSSFWLVLFFAVSAISIFNSRIVGLSFYQLLKLAEFIGFYFYLKSSFGKVFSFRGVLMMTIASGFFQSVIAIAQYIKQGSLGLRLLGESPLSVNTTGVAVFIADGEKYLRAYGTTPHPNILAAWLFVAIFASYFLFLYQPSRSEDKKSLLSFLYDRNKMIGTFLHKYGLILVYPIILFAFFLTFSRVIIGLWLVSIVVWLLIAFFKNDLRGFFAAAKKPLLTMVIATAVVTGSFSFIFWPQVKSRIHISAQEEAVTQRVYYNKIAGSIAASHPLLGIGVGQFIPNFMSKFKHLPATAYQPVHNVYLLIASETGFLGLGAFLIFLFYVFYDFALRMRFKKLHHYSFFILAASFLLIGLFDHSLWTSQQGSLIFWMILACEYLLT